MEMADRTAYQRAWKSIYVRILLWKKSVLSVSDGIHRGIGNVKRWHADGVLGDRTPHWEVQHHDVVAHRHSFLFFSDSRPRMKSHERRDLWMKDEFEIGEGGGSGIDCDSES